MKSLQWRLSIGLAIGVAVLWMSAASVTGYVVKHEIDEVFDDALVEAAQRLLGPAIHTLIERQRSEYTREKRPNRSKRSQREDHDDDDDDDDRHEKDRHAEENNIEDLHIDERLTFVARDPQGHLLLRSDNAKAGIFPQPVKPGFIMTDTHSIYSSFGARGDVIISVADPLKRRQEAVRQTLFALAMPLLFLVPLSVLGVWFMVRGSMRSLNGFRVQIEKRGSDDLTGIETSDLPSEIEPVADAVNNLISRLSRTLEAERSFTANSAHELRTPVAAALAQTQMLIAETSELQAKERSLKIETALKSLSQLTEKLMQLARAEGGALKSDRAQDMAPVIKLVLQDFRQAQSRIDLNLPEEPVPLKIDANAFAILARNLIENALKHGDQDGSITISLTENGVLSVTNDCPAIPPEMLSNLVHPFVRGKTHANGSGVGLAIVSAIAKGTGAMLSFSSPMDDSETGFQVEVKFQT